MRCVLGLAIGLASVVGLQSAGPDNWPQFRGASGGIIPDAAQIPERWSSTENVAWKVDVPGKGWGSPIVWGDYVFVTSEVTASGVERKIATPGVAADKIENKQMAEGQGPDPDFTTPRTWVLHAFDFKTGARRWQTELYKGVPLDRKYQTNTYASETPATDGRYVYVHHAAAGVFAVDFKGRVVWSRVVRVPETEPGKNAILEFGSGSSPIVHDGRLYLTMDHYGKQWMLVALDAASGNELWRTHHAKKVDSWGWSTPYVWQHARTEIVAAGDRGVRSFSPDGKLLWEFTGLAVNISPTPFAADGVLYLSSNFPGDRFQPLAAIRAGASGDISLQQGETSNAFVAWSHTTGGSYMTSGLVYKGHYYSVLTQGFMVCHDAKTGEVVYAKRRIDVNAPGFTASPWAYNGKIFVLSEDGTTYAIQPGPDFKVLHTNTLDAEATLATPAIADHSIIIRTASHLYRIAQRK